MTEKEAIDNAYLFLKVNVEKAVSDGLSLEQVEQTLKVLNDRSFELFQKEYNAK